ncbi:ABC transporter permease [Chryseolinea lacunae]|uniref:ABC transporter permease n=1 Tax=Chryseolinea lacunae TaxID=2801331 RepID=A0ABS1KM95_9BACT|nr:ABC transporter permease [Chryseolinea lacunae]MBL0740575.1 ABC transporter permease [Chryseolinea lacunae]
MFKTIFHAAWRHLTKNKVSAILNVTGLTIGLATCLIIAVWAERELTFDNFHANADAKFRIWNEFKSEAETFTQAPSGVALGAQLPKEIADIASACRVFNSSFQFKYEGEVYVENKVVIADSTFFSFFNFPIVSGSAQRLLTNPDQVVFTRSAAIKYFGSVEKALDKIVLMNDVPVTVTAVVEDAPANAHIQFDIVVPYMTMHRYAMEHWKQDLDNQWLGGWPHTYIEIHDASKWKSVEKMVNQVVAEHSKKAWADNKMSYQYFLQPIKSIHLHSHHRYDSANNGDVMTVRVFIAVAILVLLLACFNYINLTTATSVRRAKEISLRKVAGASKGQLIRQFLFETFVTTVLAVVVGVALAQMVLPLFSTWMGQSYSIPFDGLHVLGLGAFVLVVTLLSGIYPSIVLSSFQPMVALRGKFFSSESGQTFRKALVVLQFTISTVLLISILTVNRQMQFIASKPLGYEGNGVLTIDFNGDESVQKRYQVLRDALLTAPYIEGTSQHSASVVGGLGNGWISTRDKDDKEVTTSIYQMNVDPDYFDTYKMSFVAGRHFLRGTADSAKAVLVNEAAVKNLGWGTAENALGKPFGNGDNTRYVVGVVRDFHFENLHVAVQPLLVGYSINGDNMSVRVNTAHLQEGMEHLQTSWKKIMPEVPLHYKFIDESLAQQYANERKMETVFYVFAALSFFIACLGLFGLSTFMIRQRLQEISIRKVLGAPVAKIVLLLTKDFSKLVLLSVLIATPIGWMLMKEWLATFTYHTTVGWVVLVIALAIPLLISVLTVSTQAIKAAWVNPAKILRSE